MIQYKKYCLAFALLLLIGSCKKKEYSMGNLTTPTEVAITATIVGQDATHPNGDGSGDVAITLTGKNVLSYNVDYDASDGISFEFLSNGKVTKKYTKVGLNTYRITAVAYGPGASSTTVTKDIQVRSDFAPDASMVTNLTGTGSKTWKIEKDVQGHFGVGTWLKTANDPDNTKPTWWSAPPNDKSGACCNCFYTSTFKFTKVSSSSYTITIATPDGAFTKTGGLAGGLPGIPSTGAEGCYSYGGGTSSFSFAPSSSDIPASTPSTKTAIVLDGNNTFIGYGAVQKEYEILSLTATNMYLRVRGTETGNAWYLRLIPN